jgi:hypothetical protein
MGVIFLARGADLGKRASDVGLTKRVFKFSRRQSRSFLPSFARVLNGMEEIVGRATFSPPWYGTQSADACV